MKDVIGYFLTDQHLDGLCADIPHVGFLPAATREEQRGHIQDANIFLGMPSRDVFVVAEAFWPTKRACAQSKRRPGIGRHQ